MLDRKVASGALVTLITMASVMMGVACAPSGADDDAQENNSAVSTGVRATPYLTCADEKGSISLEVTRGRKATAKLGGLGANPVGFQHQITASVTHAVSHGALIQYALAESGNAVTSQDEAPTPSFRGELEEMHYTGDPLGKKGTLTLTVRYAGEAAQEITFGGCSFAPGGDEALCNAAKCVEVE
jgi:hypothetical protein